VAQKEWKDLKAKQKQRLTEIMFKTVCDYYLEHDAMPEDSALEPLARSAYARMCGAGISLVYDSILTVFIKKQNRFAERITVHGLPELPKPKVKKTEAEKKLSIKKASHKRKKRKQAELHQESFLEQDDHFFFIAGYTSGGAPYGVTWEDMGLEPWQDIEDV